MQTDADIVRRLMRAAVLRRAPLWLAAMLPWCLLLSAPGMLAALAWAAWDYRQLSKTVGRDWTRWLDGAVASLEDSSALLVRADTPVARLQRARLVDRLASGLSPEVVARVMRERVPLDWRWPAASLAAALALFAWQHRQAEPVLVRAAQARAKAAEVFAMRVKVTPPRYTGIKVFESGPRDMQAPQNSVVEWCLTAPQGAQTTVDLSDGKELTIGPGCARWSAAESMFWRWRGKRYNFKVTPDLPPEITVSAPRDMLQILPASATSATITVAVRDDYAVRRTALHLTLARGSGENIRFSDREVPVPESLDPRARNWSRQWTLAELGMEPGDELYFFVRATDNAEPVHTTVSPTYTLRLPGPVAEEDESTALPSLVKPENLRSQRQIIIDTEQLIADMKANPALRGVQARSQAIAGDQAMLRRRYGQFLGEESTMFGAGDEHEDEHEAKDDVVAQFGHAHDQAENATLFDEGTKKVLRRALTAMWDAEKALRAITPKTALAPEHKALAAIKELQQADRIYLHKTAFAPPPLKEEIRMTGDVVGTQSYSRPQATAEEPLPPEVRDLIKALSADGALPALWSRTAQDWIRARIANDEQRLAAQRAVQDVADGCATCRPVLRAWLRGAIGATPVLLQAAPQAETGFTRAWRKGGAK